ncbi:MAG: DUF2191 domain-containing protein [Deltaproteobacteria bacterium]|nr:DUF2191 domain-containing protein [Deltaproteobacteria bacterium]
MHKKEVQNMRATFNLPDPLIQDLLRVTGEKKKTKAICLAIEDFIRRKRKEKLLSLSGKINIDLDWKKLEELELKGMKERENLRKPHRHKRMD